METTSEVNAVVPRVAENELHAALGCQRGSLKGAPPILAGALVEGPNSVAVPGFVDGMRLCPPPFREFNGTIFKDDQQSYRAVEPAIALTAASFLVLAW